MSAKCRLCCKSRKLQGYEFFAKIQHGQQSPIRITSIALPKSPVSFARGDEVPSYHYTKGAPVALRIFDHQCKSTFATQSARSNISRLSSSRRRAPSNVIGSPGPSLFQRLQIGDHITDLSRIELKLRHSWMARHDALGQGLGEVLDRIFGV